MYFVSDCAQSTWISVTFVDSCCLGFFKIVCNVLLLTSAWFVTGVPVQLLGNQQKVSCYISWAVVEEIEGVSPSCQVMLSFPPSAEQKWRLHFNPAAESTGQRHDWHQLWWLNSQLLLLGARSLSVQKVDWSYPSFCCWSYSSITEPITWKFILLQLPGCLKLASSTFKNPLNLHLEPEAKSCTKHKTADFGCEWGALM